MEEKSHRKVVYADKVTLEENIILGTEVTKEFESEEEIRTGGMINTQNMLLKTETRENKRRPTLRT